MAEVVPPPDATDFDTDVLIVGAGACGMVAALAAHEAGREVLLLEADALPTGSTALSAGLIPAAGTRFQADAGIDDNPDLFAADIQSKAKGQNEQALVNAFARGAGPVVEWLADRYNLPFSLVSDFDYPGHSRRRMHGLPSRSGRELIDRLRETVEAHGLIIACNRRVDRLHMQGRTVVAASAQREDGARETIGCNRLILACNGFGGNPEMVREHLPDIADATWFGHSGNQGEAVGWSAALGAATRHLGAYQGHGNVAHPHGILITWATITEGGIQVNRTGERFWDESQGYSEAARVVLAQPEGQAFTIFDHRIGDIARQFEDFRAAEERGAIIVAETAKELAAALSLPENALAQSLSTIPDDGTDRFGREWSGRRLSPPYYGVKVTGALFHTQGGLDTDPNGRVRDRHGGLFQNLFAAGGAACSVSGASDSGYLSGNGLLSAVVLGRAAGSA